MTDLVCNIPGKENSACVCVHITGVELRLRCRWVMSGVLAEDTLQRSALFWWWCEQAVSGLAEAEREQW